MTPAAPGSSGNPTLVLVHGAVLNRRMWDPIVADLAGDFAVVAPDLPGHGTRMTEPFRMAAAVAVIRETVASVAPAPVFLVGDSLGGYVSIASASALGAQLCGAFLAGCTANLQGPVSLVYSALIALTNLFPPAKLQARLEQRIATEYAAGPAIIEGGVRSAVYAEAVGEIRRMNVRAELARLDLPMLFVNGTRDWSHRVCERGTLAAARRATLRHIPGVGHGVSLTRPAVFAGMVREFVTAERRAVAGAA